MPNSSWSYPAKASNGVGLPGRGVAAAAVGAAVALASGTGVVVPQGLITATRMPMTITAMTLALRPSNGEVGPLTGVRSAMVPAGQSPPRYAARTAGFLARAAA